MEKREKSTKVYLLDVSKINDPQLFDSWKRFLPTERWEKTVRPIREEDRKTELAAWLLLYYVLKEWGIPKEQISAEGAYYYGKHGKPARKDGKVHFNLSHSGKYVLCAISDSEIGCDIEIIRDVKWKLAKRFFSGEEYNLLEKMYENKGVSSINVNTTEELFTRFWVLRESYVKKTGEGLGSSIDDLDFSGIFIHEEEKIAKGRKKGVFLKEVFFEMEYDGYRIALCGEKDQKPEFIILSTDYIVELLHL